MRASMRRSIAEALKARVRRSRQGASGRVRMEKETWRTLANWESSNRRANRPAPGARRAGRRCRSDGLHRYRQRCSVANSYLHFEQPAVVSSRDELGHWATLYHRIGARSPGRAAAMPMSAMAPGHELAEV